MEPILTIVGFLGVGKTTLLKKMISDFLKLEYDPYIILNDYENAQIDADFFLNQMDSYKVKAQSGSCVCCSGIDELREQINCIPKRDKGITIIEANGTTDSIRLMGFLGVGIDKHFLPPIQIGVVDVRYWQRRSENNELEKEQIKTSSLVILNYYNEVDIQRVVEVEQDIRSINTKAKIINWDKINTKLFLELSPSFLKEVSIAHKHFHWSSCSIEIPTSISIESLEQIVKEIPKELLRVKGYVKLKVQDEFIHFERTPNGEIFTRKFNGMPKDNGKILTIGPGSDPEHLRNIIERTLNITSAQL